MFIINLMTFKFLVAYLKNDATLANLSSISLNFLFCSIEVIVDNSRKIYNILNEYIKSK